MDRVVLTPEDQAIIDAWKTEHGTTPTDLVLPDTNLVVDDHLRMVDAFNVVALGNEPGGYAWSYAWGAIFPLWLGQDCEDVTDRAGPNGETMPIFVPPPAPLAARSAASTSQTVSSKAPKKKHAARRELRDFLDDQKHSTAKLLRKHLIASGVLGKDDHA